MPAIQPSDIPIKGHSRKIVMDIQYLTATELYAKSITYAGCAKDAFIFTEMVNSNKSASPAFIKTVSSLTLGPTQLAAYNKTTKQGKPNYPFIFGVLYLILGFMVMGVCRIINTIIKRSPINGAKYGLIIATLACIAKIIWIIAIRSHYALDSDRTAELVGEEVGTFILPAIVLLIYAWRFYKKHVVIKTDTPTNK